eukprot:616218_1
MHRSRRACAQNKINYKEISENHDDIDTVTPITTVTNHTLRAILPHPKATFFGMYRRSKHRPHGINIKAHSNDTDDFIPLQIEGFSIVNGEKFVICDIQKRRIHKRQLINISNLHPEDYFDAIVDFEDELLSIEWITRAELNANLIPPSYIETSIKSNTEPTTEFYQSTLSFCSASIVIVKQMCCVQSTALISIVIGHRMRQNIM